MSTWLSTYNSDIVNYSIEQWYVYSEQWYVYSEQWYVYSEQWYVYNKQWSVILEKA